MTNTTIALVFVMMINLLMFLTQTAILDINPDAPEFWTGDGTVMEGYDAGGQVIDSKNLNDDLPTVQNTVNVDDNKLYTDIFGSIKGWFGSSKGIRYLTTILLTPYVILNVMGLPTSFVWAVGTMWYGLTLFLVIAFFWGRE